MRSCWTSESTFRTFSILRGTMWFPPCFANMIIRLISDEQLLHRHNILPRKDSVFGNLGLPSDDEEEELDEAFLWGDSDDDS